jgi:hypothetical protein
VAALVAAALLVVTGLLGGACYGWYAPNGTSFGQWTVYGPGWDEAHHWLTHFGGRRIRRVSFLWHKDWRWGPEGSD